MAQPYYALQASFASGEISDDIASRVDLDKFQAALLTCTNMTVKPYGGIVKRMGSRYIGATKYSDKKSIIVRFNKAVGSAYLLEIGYKYIRVWESGAYLGIELETPFEESDLKYLRFNQSADTMYICSRKYPVKILKRNSDSDWTISDYKADIAPFEVVNLDENNKITPSALEGVITVSMTADYFSPELIGSQVKIIHDMETKTVSLSGSGTSAIVLVGKSWKIITHGTWSGSVVVESSLDGTNWKSYRKYTSSSDFNASESGSVEEYTYLRVTQSITGGSCSSDLTANNYSHEGIVELTAVTDAKNATAKVIKKIGSTVAVDTWHLSSWNNKLGYPACSCFFQDRLVFAATSFNPHVIWMSRTGDYYNFGVEKADGTITDDSAITIPIISRELHQINHLIPAQDLIVLTNGNEWIISGDSVVTPTNISPAFQTARGCSETEPQFIGNRTVYVQRRGGTIRDMGYAYDSDNYTGDDLTQLAKHLVDKYQLSDSTYVQDPYSQIMFTRNDGKIIALTYIREQKVYGWGTVETDGNYESVACVPSADVDSVFFVVSRNINGQTVRYIEEFDQEVTSDNVQDYSLVDSYKKYAFGAATTTLTGLNHLIGKTVQILADGRVQQDKIVSPSGEIELEQPAKNIVVGLKYLAKIQQPNFEIQSQDGTIQGRKAMVSEVILRLKKSLGGKVGKNFIDMSDIAYDEMMGTGPYTLFSGDKNATVSDTFSFDTKVCILHDTPLPFNLNALIRAVSFGG